MPTARSTTKAANGDGGVYERQLASGKTVYDVVWTYRDRGTGARRRGFKRGFATRTEANRFRRSVTQAADAGTYAAPSALTLGAWLSEWIDSARLKPQTRNGYKRKIRLHITPHLGHHKLNAITPLMLDRFYQRLEKEGSPGGRGPLSLSTIREIHNILSAAYTAAARPGGPFTGTPPTRSAQPPRLKQVKAARPAVVTWTGEEVATFLETVEGDHYAALWTLLVSTGMRRGEALGLRWADVDLEGGTVNVRSALIIDRLDTSDEPAPGEPRTRLVLAGTKTDSERLIHLDEDTVDVLRSHRARQNAERLALGPRWENNDLVFCRGRLWLKEGQHAGGPLNPERISAAFRRDVARAGVRPIRLHDLRHTWATIALEQGVDMKVVQEHLGHAHYSITADIYVHVSKPADREAALAVAAAFHR